MIYASNSNLSNGRFAIGKYGNKFYVNLSLFGQKAFTMKPEKCVNNRKASLLHLMEVISVNKHILKIYSNMCVSYWKSGSTNI